MSKKRQFIIILILILSGAFLRLIPHAPNFTPIAAIALFGGAYLSKRTALILPVLVMLISDIFIGSYEIKLMLSVYLSFVLCVILGFCLKKNKKAKTILLSSFLAGLIFFLITNFAVWLFTPWYFKTFSGLIQCYLMALPFFRNTLLGNIFYSAVFFGSYEIIESYLKTKSNLVLNVKNK